MARIDLRENEFFERFVGPEHVDSNDVQFWYQLLSCSFNFTRVQDARTVDKTLKPFIDLLALNNSQSLNLGSLIRVAIDRVSKIKSTGGPTTNPYYVFQSFNALYLIRSICKNYIENSSEELLVQSLRARLDTPPQAPAKASVTRVLPPHLQASQPDQQPVTQVVTNQLAGPAPEQNVGTALASRALASQQEPDKRTGAENLQEAANQLLDSREPPKTADVTPGPAMLDQFISTLIAVAVDMPLNDSTYLLQVEAINSLIVLLSAQMYSTNMAGQFYVYKTLMHKRCSIHALLLTKTLLNNFIRQDPMPQETGSIILGLASGLWRVLTLGYGSQEEDSQDIMPLLARQSLLLLNILTNHCTTEKNPYREAIISCQDSKFNISDPHDANNDALATASVSQSILNSNRIKIEFGDLFDTICNHLNNSQVALLLYLLLHSNKIFKPYLLTTASSKLDQLVLPLLKILYSSIQKGSHHVYMILIIFVILSEETAFNRALHEIPLRSIPWFKDRILNEISLGSFTTLIMIRSFAFNTFRVKDKFLHANLFATLGNLSNHFYRLHPYVCQRLVDLLERLTKRCLAVTKPPKSAPARFNPALEVLGSDNPLARALATDTQKQDLQDVSSIELDSTSNNGAINGNVSVNIRIPEQQLSNDSGNSSSAFLPPVDMHGQEFGRLQASGQTPPGSDHSPDHINISMDDTKLDIAWIEDVISMILKIINNSLATQLDNNPDLIYTLLYKRSVFTSLLSSHQSFYNLVINVERILTFFYNTIEACQRQLSGEEIKDIIQNTSKDWSFESSKDPDSQLLFQYVEDDEPQEFFIPFVWNQVYYLSGISWCPKRIVLFNPEIA